MILSSVFFCRNGNHEGEQRKRPCKWWWGHPNKGECPYLVSSNGFDGVETHPSFSSEKRKTVSKTINTRNLPGRWGNKKPMLGSFTPSKSLVVELDPSITHVASTQLSMTPKANTPFPDASPSLNPSIATPPKRYQLTLLTSESLA